MRISRETIGDLCAAGGAAWGSGKSGPQLEDLAFKYLEPEGLSTNLRNWSLRGARPVSAIWVRFRVQLENALEGSGAERAGSRTGSSICSRSTRRSRSIRRRGSRSTTSTTLLAPASADR